jgi:hypothetical protein
MRMGLMIVGALAVLAGLVWTLQGLDDRRGADRRRTAARPLALISFGATGWKAWWPGLLDAQ